MRPRTLLITAVFALLATTTIARWTPALAEPGRDYSRCIQTCHAFGNACAERCPADCEVLFPGDEARIAECTKECRARCTDLDKECRAICKIIKKPTSFEEP